jgi:hypothetical protein
VATLPALIESMTRATDPLARTHIAWRISMQMFRESRERHRIIVAELKEQIRLLEQTK